MDRNVQICFVEEGSAENPFSPRAWPFVPRVGDSVLLPETRRAYRVVAVEWSCAQRPDGSYDENEPLVIVRISE